MDHHALEGPVAADGLSVGERLSSSYGLWIALTLLALSHFVVDAYANAIPAILGLLEVRCRLSTAQTAWFAGYGALTSGLAQPLFAWLADRFQMQLMASLGLAVAALGFGWLGLASSPGTLFALYGIAMLGVAMYHPIAASAMGQLWPQHRSLLVSLFFVAGVSGSTLGALVGPVVASSEAGFVQLRWSILPACLLALLMHWSWVSSGRTAGSRRWGGAAIPPSRQAGWLALGLLYASSVLRFSVNLVLFYLFLRWLSQQTLERHPNWTPQQISDAVAPTLGRLIAITQVGMACGGLTSGLWVTPHRERAALIGIPMLFAPSIVFFPMATPVASYGLAFLAGGGLAAMIPVSISVAQRWLPHHPSLASGLMLGGAWALSMVSPPLIQAVLDGYGLGGAFVATALLLFASGVCVWFVPPATFRTIVP